MKNGLYTEAIELYNSAYAADGALASQIQFNLSICYERLARKYKPQNIIVQEQPLAFNSTHLMSNPEMLISLYRGHIDAMDENAIHGWIYDSNNVARVVQLDLYGNGVLLGTASANLPRHDVKMAGEAKAECGFLLEFGTHVSLTEFNSFEVYISGTKELAFKEKLETSKITPQIDRLSKLAKIVRKESEQKDDPSLNWITNQLIPYLFQQVRNNLLENFPEDGAHKISKRSKKSEIVDIIIPVYEGLEETIGCINSALNAENKTPHRIIVINDASPNAALTVAL
ncbi:MAG: glycosyltransferase family 2 protein, partial [Pedobacter sp.]